MKKLISILLSALLITSVICSAPLTVFAAAEESQSIGASSGTTGDCTWTLDDEGNLTISGNGAMEDYTNYNGPYKTTAPWGANIKSVVIENGVTNIGEYAFYGCAGLTSVTIPDSVTSIGREAFYECTGLTSVTIPDSVTSIVDYAFLGCKSLTSVTIGNSVTSIGEFAFYGCTCLTSITVDSGNKIYDSRNNCNAIIKTDENELWFGCKSTVIPDSVTSIGSSAFDGCTGLTSVTIPYSVTSIGYDAFSGCTGLTNITVDSGNKIYDSRNNCNAIIKTAENELLFGCKSTVIPDSVKSIGRSAFYECTGLTSVDIPDSVTSIGYSAFSRCSGLTSVNIGNGVTSIGDYVFLYCTGLTSATIGNSVTSIGESAFSGCESLTSVTIGNSVTSIGRSAFCDCDGLTSVIIPDSVTSIGDYAFSDCTGLTSITVDSGNKVYDSRNNCNAIIKTAENELLFGCKSTVIPNSVTSIGDSAFAGCDGLKSVTIPDSVKSIGRSAFYECTGLTSVDIPDSVTSIGSDAFSICKSLTSVTIGNSVTSIGDYAFEDCTGLTSIDIPDSVTSIGRDAFYGCERLTSVTIPDSVTSIGSSAFYNTAWYYNQPNGLIYAGKVAYKYKGTMPNNTSIVIKEGTKGIAGYAFSGCTGLTSITIPDSVTSIGDFAFFCCTGLTSVTIPDSVMSIGEFALGYYYNSGYKKVDDFTIYGVKNSAAEKYANDNGFTFVEIEPKKNQIYSDEETNITVTTDEGLTLKVIEKSETEAGDIVLGQGEAIQSVYDISLLKDGAEVQPDGKVTVKIPCDNDGAKVYRVENDNTLTDMNAVYENGYLVFTTEHFSVYVVSVPKTYMTGDVNGDNVVDIFDATLIQKYAVDKITLTDEQKEVADVNDDGIVDIFDATDIQKFAVEKITEFKK